MRYSRAERRHHTKRLKIKRAKQLLAFSYTGRFKNFNRSVGRWVNTRTFCSCTMCASPRKLYGNGKNAKTRQEQIKSVKEKD